MNTVVKNIALSPEQEVRYLRVADELVQKSGIEGVAFPLEVAARYPEKVVWKGKKSRCLVTRQVIKRGQECVVIFSTPYEREFERGSREILAVLADEQALFHLIEVGSLEDLRRESRASMAPEAKQKPVYPQQNVCYCVQCGIRIIRSEGMSLVQFAKIYRCANCQEGGIAMPLTSKRYCRTCGVPFMPVKGTQRICSRCCGQSAWGKRKDGYEQQRQNFRERRLALAQSRTKDTAPSQV